MHLRTRVYEIVEVARPGDRASRTFDVFLMSLVFLNVVAVMLETVDQVYVKASQFLGVFEIISIALFTIEYVLRVWSSVENPLFGARVQGRVRFMVTPLAMIDLCAILPFFVSGLGLDLRFVRAFRLLRFFRIAKLGRYSASLQLLGRIVKAKKHELSVTFFVMLMLLVVASSLVYYAEAEAQPGVFTSIPAAMWWGVCTLTTVGYGDTYPITAAGRLIASAMAVLGVGMFALPAGILGGAFVEELQRADKKASTCPRCGADLREVG